MFNARAMRSRCMTSRAPRRRVIAAAVTALVLAGCSADTNPVRDVFVATGIGANPKPAPDFVLNSRPEAVDYIPVGVSAPARPIRGKTVAETKAAEAELDRERAALEAKAAEARLVGEGKALPAPPAGGAKAKARQVGATPAPAPAAAAVSRPAQGGSPSALRGTN